MMIAQLVDIGHTAVMVPVAAAIGAWLVMGRTWRLALCWCLMFAAGLSIVAMSKIAFLGWETGIPSIDFQALSGHAFRSAAVIPVFFFVVLQVAQASWRAAGVVFGMVVSLGVGVLLVRFQFHTVSEVIPSLALGSTVSLGFVRVANKLPAPLINRWSVLFSLTMFLVMCGLKPSKISPHLVDVALYLSGRDYPHLWSRQQDVQSPRLVCRPANSSFRPARSY
ncbi:membrane-associated phospholipid phosphatase [Massilia sp. Mn16-1_5]|uniref:membrane-associated phospholipid phosphatase n=1 Tax=Massilia sp. Mn16-1_5 TaxID=2079199 RepID=UPI00109ED5A2|nr:membrane-associated phospholipid phosphatase [Massilia sp. Mn16-1_5]THC42565.1 membrane-associated phospholipid phosphatase [Massilia sp. Mn16-1_5]